MTANRIRLVVDEEKCQGHNRCRLLAPDLVEIDDLGFAHAKGEGAIVPEQADKARLAVKNCPEFALRLETDET